MVAVSPILMKFARQVKKEHGLAFPLLLDPGNRVASRYGLVFTFPDYLREVYLDLGIDLERYNGDDSWTLPMPARFIIDRTGIIRDAEAHPDYTVRPEPQETVRRLRELDLG